MIKIWLMGIAFRIPKKLHLEMNEYVADQVGNDDPKAGPTRPAKIDRQTSRPYMKADSERVALEFLRDNGVIGEDGKPKFEYASIIVVLVGTTLALLEYFLGPESTHTLAQLLLAALTTGAGVNTVTPAQTQTESDVVVGDIDTTGPLRGLKVNVDGDTTIDIQNSQPLVSVLAKLSQFMTGSGVIGLILKIATGRYIAKATVITFTNDAATTPAVYWNSQRGNQKAGRLIRAKQSTININTPGVFNGTDFAYLAVTNPANINSFDFTFGDGTQQNMTVIEADALFSKSNQTEANGRLDALVTCIDNTKGNIQQVRVNTGAVAVTTMIVQ